MDHSPRPIGPRTQIMEETPPVSFTTVVRAQCRNKPSFYAKIWFQNMKDAEFPQAVITCPHCSRNYYFSREKGWFSDRPLKFAKES